MTLEIRSRDAASAARAELAAIHVPALDAIVKRASRHRRVRQAVGGVVVVMLVTVGVLAAASLRGHRTNDLTGSNSTGTVQPGPPVVVEVGTVPDGSVFGNRTFETYHNSDLNADVYVTTTRYQRAEPRATFIIEVSQLLTPVDVATLRQTEQRVTELRGGLPLGTVTIRGHEATIHRTTPEPDRGLIVLDWRERPDVWIAVIGRDAVQVDELIRLAGGLILSETDSLPTATSLSGSTTTTTS